MATKALGVFFYLEPSMRGLDVKWSFYLSHQGPWTPPVVDSGNSRPCSASTSSDTS